MDIANWLEELLKYYYYDDAEKIAQVLELLMKELWKFSYNENQEEYCEKLQICLENIMRRNMEEQTK